MNYDRQYFDETTNQMAWEMEQLINLNEGLQAEIHDLKSEIELLKVNLGECQNELQGEKEQRYTLMMQLEAIGSSLAFQSPETNVSVF